MASDAPSRLERYRAHLDATAGWLEASIAHGRGGSAAHWSPLGGWSRPYPETTGYLITTLLALHPRLPARGLLERAREVGGWLLSIQNAEGSWNGGLHPARRPKPSVFNTGQIVSGLVDLHRGTREARWLEAALRGARWLADGVGPDGLWQAGDYRSAETPSYYTYVAWPMLEAAREAGEPGVEAAARRVLERILARVRPNGAIERWGFGEDGRAFTHTIAYTLRGLLESARVLGAWQEVGAPAVPALRRLAEESERAGGALPGAFDLAWSPTARYVCLTGNAQTAVNLLLLEERAPDPRLVEAAAALVDRVCRSQRLRAPLRGLRGGVAGSSPPWGRYMTLRWPNWAAKFHADALLLLAARLEREAGPCTSSS
jgi:hypothetical protein